MSRNSFGRVENRSIERDDTESFLVVSNEHPDLVQRASVWVTCDLIRCLSYSWLCDRPLRKLPLLQKMVTEPVDFELLNIPADMPVAKRNITALCK